MIFDEMVNQNKKSKIPNLHYLDPMHHFFKNPNSLFREELDQQKHEQFWSNCKYQGIYRIMQELKSDLKFDHYFIIVKSYQVSPARGDIFLYSISGVEGAKLLVVKVMNWINFSMLEIMLQYLLKQYKNHSKQSTT